MHGYRYTAQEAKVADLAKTLGFTQVSASHQVSPLIKFVSRGDTTVVDAYVSPILRRYVNQVAEELEAKTAGLRLMFMQSNGGLADAHFFKGKDSILSGRSEEHTSELQSLMRISNAVVCWTKNTAAHT